VVVENGDDVGLIEIKCMMPANHLDVLMKREVPSQYRKQVQYQLECAEAEWSDFVCFNPSFPSGADLVVIRVHRDEDLIASLVDDIIQINAEVSEAIRSLRNEYNLEAV
jgi:predicted phage-related endonuclease